MDTKFPPTSMQSSNSENISLLLTSCVIGVLMVFLVYSKNFVFGSEPGNWTYSYFKTITSVPLWIPISVLLLLGLSIFIGKRLIFFHEKITLFGCFLIAIFIQVLIHDVYPVPLGTIVQSDNANAFYTVARQYSPIELLAQYDTSVSSLPSHAKSNMPGKILLFQLFNLFTSSPQVMGYLVIVLSTFGALLLYGICKKLFNDKQAAFYAFILYILIPGKLFFFPILNSVTPVFILLCLYLFITYIERKEVIFLLLLGCALYILILFEPSPLVTGIIFIGILLNAIGEKRLSKKGFWVLLLITFLAFLCVYAIFFIFFSFNLMAAFQYVLKDAANFNLTAHRPYRLWIAENFKEFFYSAGTPVLVIFIYLVSRILVQWKTLKCNIINWSMENIYIISILVTFGIVLFLGVNRGEISRLWIYLAVFFQIPASLFIAKIPKNTVLFILVASTLVIQSIITLQRVSFINP